jgi:hypothetical protein
MNRPIKFKVWDKMRLQFIYPENNNQQHFIIDLNGQFHNLQNGSGGNDYVVLEYTGLTDSKDKEICDGDILKIDYDTFGNVIGQVLYETYQGGYIFQYKRNGPNQNYINLNCDVAFESVIVGNIFEHAELLNY